MASKFLVKFKMQQQRRQSRRRRQRGCTGITLCNCSAILCIWQKFSATACKQQFFCATLPGQNGFLGKVRHEDPKKRLHDVCSFIGACNFYRRHTSAILTDLIKESSTWRWGPQEQQAFEELKDKVANTKCLGVPRAQGEIIPVTDACNVGGGGRLFQWQALEKEEFDSAIFQWGTDGLNQDGTLKHSYPDNKWVLVPLGHWNWKWNQAPGNYSTYVQELLAGMLVLSSQSRLLGSNPVVWL